MLTWTRVNGNWRGNGFLIKPHPTREWDLYEAPPRDESSHVFVEELPLASLPTLSACKYKAETLHSQTEVASTRARLGVVSSSSVAIMFLTGNPLVVIACGVVATAALIELVMTWFGDLPGRVREIIQ